MIALMLVWLVGSFFTFKYAGGIAKEGATEFHPSNCSTFRLPASRTKFNGTKLWDANDECDCQTVKTNLTFRMTMAVLMSLFVWPLAVAAYIYVNTARAIALGRGRNWSFFSEPHMIPTIKERQQKLDAARKKLDKDIAKLEADKKKYELEQVS